MTATLKSLLVLFTVGVLGGAPLSGAVSAESSANGGAERAPFEFRGYFSEGAGYVFVVSDPAGAETRRLHLGESWRGGTITSFDMRADQLGVRREGVDLVLPLRGSAQTAPTRKVRIVQGPASPVLENGKLVYSPDTVLQIGEKTITAQSGRIRSDYAQTVFEGDFRVVDSTRRDRELVMLMPEGKLDAVTGGLSGQNVRVTIKTIDPVPPAEATTLR